MQLCSQPKAAQPKAAQAKTEKILAPLLDYVKDIEKQNISPKEYGGIEALDCENYTQQMSDEGKYTYMVPLHELGLDTPASETVRHESSSSASKACFRVALYKAFHSATSFCGMSTGCFQ